MVLWEFQHHIQGETKAGMELPCSFVFGDLYILSTVLPSISVAVHSTSLSVFDELIGIQQAEFFTNVAVPWKLLLVQAAKL